MYLSLSSSLSLSLTFFGQVLSPVFVQGVFVYWYPPKELKYGKPGLVESTLT